jgi:putative ABC transport system ATP-binding protein
MSAAMLSAMKLTRIYRRGSEEVRALDGVDFEARAGEVTAVTGPSGSGKTTLLNIIGCLDNPTSGFLSVDGEEIFGSGRTLSEKELTLVRRRVFGYIFQKFYLIPTLTVRENILLPSVFRALPPGRSAEEAMRLLGIEKRAGHLPGQLSGGEMQRVAIARAIINSPKVILADEPTGSLDSARAGEISAILRGLASDGMAVVLVTHNQELAGAADREIKLRDGKTILLS